MSWTAIVWAGAILAAAMVGWWLIKSRRQARSLATHLTGGEDVPEIGRDHREGKRWLEEHGRDGDHDSGGDHGGSGGGDGD